MQAIAAERSSDRIFLRADGANEWNKVAEVMGALNAGGFSNIGLVTDIGAGEFGGAAIAAPAIAAPVTVAPVTVDGSVIEDTTE